MDAIPRLHGVNGAVIYDFESGGTRSVLSVHREKDGALVIAGQDLGTAPRAMFGDGDYEYWITIPPPHAAIEVSVLREVANGDPGGSRAIRAWLDERSVPFGFHSYT